jgi:hypothetical protein
VVGGWSAGVAGLGYQITMNFLTIRLFFAASLREYIDFAVGFAWAIPFQIFSFVHCPL